MSRRQALGRLIASLFALIGTGAVIGWMFLRVLRGELTLGDLALFYQVFSRGQGLLRSFFNSTGQILTSGLFLENLFKFLDIKREVKEPFLPLPTPERLREGISVEGVTFRYPGSKRNSLDNFDIFIPAGKIVAIVGENGAGKSTLLKLICRFYDTEKGCIKFDGIDIKQFSEDSLRRMITVLFQFPLNLFLKASQTITAGDFERKVTIESIENAAKLAGADEFIRKLPDGYSSLLGKIFENGSQLSGGQWQRLAMARAFFRHAPIIMLDEPTSFMDSWSEADWFDRFRKLADGRTALLITHRFTIAMRADLIYVLHEGRVLESGSHRELIELDGHYSHSWKEQMTLRKETLGQNSGSLESDLMPLVKKSVIL